MKLKPLLSEVSVKFKKLSPTATVPTRGSSEAAGYDLYADNDEMITIQPHQTVMIPTNIAMAIPSGYFGGIYARSGLACKRGLRPANCTGVADCDFRGNITVSLHNDTDLPRVIDIRERIAQLIIQPFVDVEFEEVEELEETERGEGGFGSTGTK